MKVYRRHYCARQHRSYRTFARCVWPRAAWVAGDGPYAVVAYCKVTTVTLHATYERAAEAKAAIDSGACGGRCIQRHEVLYLDTGEQPRRTTDPIPYEMSRPTERRRNAR